jgi:hypothetical protein
LTPESAAVNTDGCEANTVTVMQPLTTSACWNRLNFINLARSKDLQACAASKHKIIKCMHEMEQSLNYTVLLRHQNLVFGSCSDAARQ